MPAVHAVPDSLLVFACVFLRIEDATNYHWEQLALDKPDELDMAYAMLTLPIEAPVHV